MGRTKILVIVSLVLLVCFSLVWASPWGGSPDIEVTLVSQDPDPVEPGQVVEVRFKVENVGKESTTDNVVQIFPKHPFSIYNDVIEKNIGKMKAGQTGADAVVVKFKLKVDENAVEGEAEIELMVKVAENVWSPYTDGELMIDIQTHDAVLDIVQINSDPEEIPPGGLAKIDILVKNLADSLLKDIKFKLELEGSSLPFAPYQSSSERRISQLQTDYQKSLSFQIIADPEAAPGLYKVPLNITYNDETGTAYAIDDVMAVVVGEVPKIRTYIKKSSVLQSGEGGKITLEIANAGSSDIKFLELFLLPSEDYQLLSTSDYFYLGDVDSDDTESEEIEVFVNKKVKELNFPVKLKYYDANNKPFQQQFDLVTNVYSTWQLKKFGLLERSKVGIYLLFLVIIVIGIFLYRSYKKDPEKFSKTWGELLRKVFFWKKKK